MKLIRKIIKIALKVIAGIFAFYLLLTLVILPLISPWLIRSQVSKLLGHAVKVRSVQFNPFLCRLTIKGLEVLDSNKLVLVGFDTFRGDFSFISLFKKSYRIESLGLHGLKVNAELTQRGDINLLGLVPKTAEKPIDARNHSIPPHHTAIAQKTAQSPEKIARPLPPFFIDIITLSSGTVRFTDRSVTPHFSTVISDMKLSITDLSTLPQARIKVSFAAILDEKGTIVTETLIEPFVSPFSMEATFKLNDYALSVLTPYVGKYTGRAVKSGKLSLSMNYRIAGNELKASHKVSVQSFDFGNKVVSKDALNLPFGLAVALLEDSRERITIALPVSGDMSKPDFHYFHLIGQVLRNFFLKLVTKPFAFLGSIAGMESGSEEFGYIRFPPGRVDLADTENEKLNMIVKALQERPKLSLQIKGGYDPLTDWGAIKTDIFNKNFRLLKEESRRLESWVYQELYQRRFGIRALWKLTRSYRSKKGVYDETKLNEEIKRQLIEDGSADKTALSALAEERAKVIYDFIVAAGFDAKRMSIGTTQESQGSAGSIPSEIVLTVFEDSSHASDDSLLPAQTKQ